MVSPGDPVPAVITVVVGGDSSDVPGCGVLDGSRAIDGDVAGIDPSGAVTGSPGAQEANELGGPDEPAAGQDDSDELEDAAAADDADVDTDVDADADVDEGAGALSSRHAPPRVALPTASAGLILPARVELSWPELPGLPLVDLLDSYSADAPAVSAAALLRAFVEIGRSLEPFHQQGVGLLAPWSFRWTGQSLTLAVCDLLDAGKHDPVDPWFVTPAGECGPARDLRLFAVVLFKALTGEWSNRDASMLAMAGLAAGEWPPGADAALRACLHPEHGRRAAGAGALASRIAPFVFPARNERLTTVVACESVTGWRKAGGNPEGDNEDAVGWAKVEDPSDGTTTACAVLDGITGPGDGSGRWAARALLAAFRRRWKDGETEPERLLLDVALPPPPAPLSRRAAAVAVLASISRGRADIATVGDCRAYLLRRCGDGFAATRLSSEHSVVAEAIVAGQAPTPEERGIVTESVRTAQRGATAVATRRVQLADGDLLILATDGACEAGVDTAEDIPGVADWRFCDVLEDLASVARTPAELASLLCRRAEDLGGHDNATVAVIAIRSAREKVVATRTRPRQRAMLTGVGESRGAGTRIHGEPHIHGEKGNR